MDVNLIKEAVSLLVADLYSLDTQKQTKIIQKYYDPACRLQNPYMILAGRDEIIRIFTSLAKQNTELNAQITNIDYNAVQQVVTLDLQEVINPKALGGILPIKIHQVIKLQLESSAASGGTLDSRYLYITDHHEVHTVQEYISRIPVVGSWYDGSIREAMGKLMLTGSSLLDATGIMDYVPGVVSSALGVASSAATRVGEVAEGALAVTHRAADATGVSYLASTAGAVVNTTVTSVSNTVSATVSSVSNTVSSTRQTVAHAVDDATNKVIGVARHTALVARLQAARWVEEARETKIRCYSPTCVPGIRCYSPSCDRNKPDGGFSPQDVVAVVYSSFSKK